MSLLFADIFEAIRYLRLSKGTTEKDIMKYVQEKVGGCMSVGNVLKTIRCLNKLVEEGVLCKKGRRYIFSSKNNAKRENIEIGEKEYDDDEDEDDDDDDDNEEEKEDEAKHVHSRKDWCDEDDDEDEEEEEEEEEDDDDDDDDDDGDDDDGEEYDDCNEKDNILTDNKTLQNQDRHRQESKSKSSISKNKSPISNNGDSNHDFNKSDGKNDNETNNSPICKNNAKKHPGRGGHRPRKGNKKKHSGYSKNSRRKGRRGEGFSYCSQDIPCQSIFPQGMAAIKEENLNEMHTSPNLELRKIYQARRRDAKPKKSRTKINYRSRSPIQGNKAFHNLKLETSDDLGQYNSQMFQEVTEGGLDVGLKKNDDKESSGDLSNRESTPEVLIPGPPGNLEHIKEPSIEKTKKPSDKIKIKPAYDCDTKFTFKRNIDSRQSLQIKENLSKKSQNNGDRSRDKHKRGLSLEDEKSESEERPTSLCSTCEKKKRNS